MLGDLFLVNLLVSTVWANACKKIFIRLFLPALEAFVWEFTKFATLRLRQSQPYVIYVFLVKQYFYPAFSLLGNSLNYCFTR
jgi:hypothetical protein